jgi:xylulokinase
LQEKAEKITGNQAMPGFTAPKLLWVAKHEPELFSQVEKVLLPKDYLRLCMTGVFATDLSDASGTLWLDVGKRDWSDEMLTACSLTRNQMPELFEGSAATATLLPEVAKEWGMPPHAVVAAGAGDNAAGAVGLNVVTAGSAYLSLGTSGVYFVANDKYQPNPSGAVHTFCHCLPRLWHL